MRSVAATSLHQWLALWTQNQRGRQTVSATSLRLSHDLDAEPARIAARGADAAAASGPKVHAVRHFGSPTHGLIPVFGHDIPRRSDPDHPDKQRRDQYVLESARQYSSSVLLCPALARHLTPRALGDTASALLEEVLPARRTRTTRLCSTSTFVARGEQPGPRLHSTHMGVMQQASRKGHWLLAPGLPASGDHQSRRLRAHEEGPRRDSRGATSDTD